VNEEEEWCSFEPACIFILFKLCI